MTQIKTIKNSIFIALVCISAIIMAPIQAEEENLPLKDLQVFVDVFSKIKNDYVDQVDDSDLIKGAIHGMLNNLDPHSSFLDADDFKEMRSGTEGKFGGLGIEVSSEDGLIKVVAPIDDTPAYEAGLESGDLIIRLDGESIKDMNLRDAVEKMRGAPGTQIILTIARKGVNDPFDVTLTRAVIKIASVKSSLLDGDYAYIRIASFQSNTGESLRSKIKKLNQEVKDGIRGLILDLRNNPGGVLGDAIEVADVFLTDGVIVSIRGREDDADYHRSAAAEDLLKDRPMVILVNGGSASASEIVAGALQDHGRAIIMGTQTFGKGSVQTVIPLSNGAAIKITTARYYTPNNRSIQATGIIPDIITEQANVVQKETTDNLRESDLAGHLKNENGQQENNDESDDSKTIDLIEHDFQIREALNLLKGMDLLKRRTASM